MINIFVDDVRIPPEPDFVQCWNSQEALALLAKVWTDQQEFVNPDFDIGLLSLDHDLGDSDSILPVVRFLIALDVTGHALRVQQIRVHSANPVGSFYMVDQLGRHYNVTRGLLGTSR